jgi:hypothetical protein
MAPCNRSITICKQQLGSAGGDSNLFTGNVQVLECNSKPSGAGAGSYVPSATPPYTGGSDAAQIINDINKTKESIFDKKTFGVNNKILLAIMAIVLILLYITDDEEGGENYRNPIGYVQPNYNTYRKY